MPVIYEADILHTGQLYTGICMMALLLATHEAHMTNHPPVDIDMSRSPRTMGRI